MEAGADLHARARHRGSPRREHLHPLAELRQEVALTRARLIVLAAVALAAAAGLLGYRSLTREALEVEAVAVPQDGRTLRLYGFTVPDRPLIGASTEESGDEVRVGLVAKSPLAGSNDGPAALACAEVVLDEPLGRRRVVDAESGRRLRPGRPPSGQTRASMASAGCARH